MVDKIALGFVGLLTLGLAWIICETLPHPATANVIMFFICLIITILGVQSLATTTIKEEA